MHTTEAWRHSQAPMRKHIKITYSIVTPESAAQGDIAESGWEDEEGIDMTPDWHDRLEGPTPADLAVKFLQDKGACHASSSVFHKGLWYSDEAEQDYRDGTYTTYSYHLYGFSLEEERAIYNGLFGRLCVTH